MNNPHVHHHYVVHAIHFSLPIKPTIMGGIIRRLMDFDENFINKSNIALTLWNLGSQHLLLLCHKLSYLITLSYFIYKKKLIKHCFKNNLNNHLKMQGGSFENLLWLITIETTSYTNSSNFPKMKLTRLLNKHGVAHMVAKMSHTYIGVKPLRTLVL